MKRWILILLSLSVLIFCAYVFFYNGIPSIERMTIQTYNHKTETYGKGKVVTDKSSIKTFTRILNRGRHETRTRYKMAYHDDYLVTVTYENGGTHEFMVWESSGRYTHIIRAGKSDSFKISSKGSRKELLKILD